MPSGIPRRTRPRPQWTYPVGTGENFAIAPGDFAMQYDVPNSSLNPSYTGTTYDGTGQTIAIVNESNINIAAVNAFRSTFWPSRQSSAGHHRRK